MVIVFSMQKRVVIIWKPEPRNGIKYARHENSKSL